MNKEFYNFTQSFSIILTGILIMGNKKTPCPTTGTGFFISWHYLKYLSELSTLRVVVAVLMVSQ
jgi:hypothetical protein